MLNKLFRFTESRINLRRLIVRISIVIVTVPKINDDLERFGLNRLIKTNNMERKVIFENLSSASNLLNVVKNGMKKKKKKKYIYIKRGRKNDR